MTEPLPHLLLVGAGRLGPALGLALRRAGAVRRLTVAGRRPAPPDHPLFAGPDPASWLPALPAALPLPSDLSGVLLCVPDDAVEPVAAEMARLFAASSPISQLPNRSDAAGGFSPPPELGEGSGEGAPADEASPADRRPSIPEPSASRGYESPGRERQSSSGRGTADETPPVEAPDRSLPRERGRAGEGVVSATHPAGGDASPLPQNWGIRGGQFGGRGPTHETGPLSTSTWPESIPVLHCAGSLGAEALAPLAEAGASVGSVHPLAAVADAVSGADRLRGVSWGVEGEGPARALAERIVAALDGRALAVAPGGKPLYHAAAVAAANYATALLGMAERWMGGAGVPEGEARAALCALAAGAVDNVAGRGPAAALTGPVSRGDDGTLRRHRARLSGDEAAVYCLLGREALALAEAAGLDPAAAERVRRALGGEGEE